MGSKDNGKLGRGSSLPTSSRGNVTVGKVDKFFDSNETTQLLNDVKIGYVRPIIFLVYIMRST